MITARMSTGRRSIPLVLLWGLIIGFLLLPQSVSPSKSSGIQQIVSLNQEDSSLSTLDGNDTGDNADECTLSLLIPFGNDVANDNTDVNPIRTPEDYIQDGLSLMTIAALAVDDFNTRKSKFVSDLETNIGSCPSINQDVQFTNIQLIDNTLTFDDNDASCNVVMVLGGGSPNTKVLNPLETIEDGEAFATTITSSNTILVPPPIFLSTYGPAWGLITGGDNSAATSLILSTATWQERMDVLMNFLEIQMGTTRSALLYDAPTDTTRESYFDAFKNAAEGADKTIHVIDSPISSGTITTNPTTGNSDRSRNQIEDSLRRIRNNFIDTIVVAWDGNDGGTTLRTLANVAVSMGMTSNEYTWIVMDSFLSPQYIDNLDEISSENLSQFLEHSLIFQVLDPFVPVSSLSELSSTNQRDLVIKELHDRSDLLDVTNKLLEENNFRFKIDTSFFDDDRRPAYGSGYLYDSVIAAGLTAACSNDDVATNIDFEGVTGKYQIQQESRTGRASGNVEFGLFEIQQQQLGGVDDIQYISILRNFTSSGGQWVETLEESIDHQNLGVWACATGFTLAGIAFIYCVAAFIFLFRNRQNAIVAMGQPIFLQFVCFGCIFFAFSIVFQSFDDHLVPTNGDLNTILDTMCMLQVWMAYAGQIIVYMSLFTKLWRVKKVGQMRKNTTVLPRHVIWPFLLFIVVSFGVLVTWTIVDPATFDRIEVESDEGIVSYPLCTYEVGFHIALQVPLFISMLIVLVMSYKTRHLPENITDSRRISRVLVSHVLVTFFGFILIAVGYYAIFNYNFIYMIRVLTNFLYSVLTVGLLVQPRYTDVQNDKKGIGTRRYTEGHVRISGLDSKSIEESSQNVISSASNYSSRGANSARGTGKGGTGLSTSL